MKLCKKCGETKPLDGFHRNRSTPDGRQGWCKPCLNGATLAWYHRKSEEINKRRYGVWKDYYKRRHVIKRSGMTPEELAALPQACGICGQEGVPLEMDHSHATNEFRGLLCRSCNVGLGCFKDDTGILKAAIYYLEQS